MSGVRYCPKCGAQNDPRAAACARCALVFSEYRPSPVVMIRPHGERRQNITLWMLGGLLLIVALLAGYMMSVQPLLTEAGGQGRTTLQEMADRTQAVFTRLREAPGEEERRRAHGEITEILATLTLIPEGQDMETNLLLQRTLHELDTYTGARDPMDRETVRDFVERLGLIGRMVRPSAPSTP